LDFLGFFKNLGFLKPCQTALLPMCDRQMNRHVA